MPQYTFKILTEDGRPVFTSNGVRVLLATGSDTHITMLEPEVLKEKFGAELIRDNVKMNAYGCGECVGTIYKLAHFPLDGSDIDVPGLYVFNVVRSEEYSELCKDPVVDTIWKVCDAVVSMSLFDSIQVSFGEECTLKIPDDISAAVKDANAYLQVVIDKLS